MIYAQVSHQPGTVWRLPGRLSSADDRRPRPFIKSSEDEVAARYSPDGGKIVFNSTRSGVSNLWVCDADGSRPMQLTDLNTDAGATRWSPDGRAIVFDSFEEGSTDIYLIDVEGGVPRRLTNDASNNMMPSFSGDGRSIYFSSDRSGRYEVWKMSVEGGLAVQLTQGGGVWPLESHDGKSVYFINIAQDAIWQMPANGGEAAPLVRAPNLDFIEVSRSGLYYAISPDAPERWRRTEEYAIDFLDFESGQVKRLFHEEGPSHHLFLSVSPGEEWILYTVHRYPTSELVLIEGFD